MKIIEFYGELKRDVVLSLSQVEIMKQEWSQDVETILFTKCRKSYGKLANGEWTLGE